MNKDDENKAVQQPAAAEESSQQPAAEQDSGLPKTQEELDALIEKRLARERKKLAKASLGTQASGAPAAEGSAAQPEACLLYTSCAGQRGRKSAWLPRP